MMKRKYVNGKIVLLLLGSASLSFTGCRLSPTLEQVVYQENEETDNENDTDSINNNENNNQEDEQLASKKDVEDAESKRGQTRQDALAGDGNDQSDSTYNPSYEENSDPNGTGTQGSNGTSGSGDNTGSGNGNRPGGNGDLEGDKQNGDEFDPSNSPQGKQIVDARGVTIDIPENVTSVTAVGEAATIVEILGGNNRLLASSASFTGNGMAQNAFSSQGFSGVHTWWDGNGSGSISSGNFSELLAAAPDVCFEISGQGTFSESQIASLEKAGILYVVLPRFNTIGNISDAVEMVGTVLGDKSSEGGTNAPAIAKKYADWAESIVNKVRVQGEETTKSTLFISAWDSDAYWEIKNNKSGVYLSGYGAAIGRNGAGISSLNDCMGIANLSNEASDNVYVNPLLTNFWGHEYSGGTGIFKASIHSTRNAAGIGLGNEKFPAVIVADSSIIQNIENDIHWHVYGKEGDGGNGSMIGFSDGNGHVIGSSIEGDYDIYVNPTGLGSWTEGSVEAPLEAAWLSCKFQNGCTMNELRSMITEFYDTFYHINVDTSSILGE